MDEYNQIEARLNALHQLLRNSDYIAAKIAEGSATREEYAEIISKRQAWRTEINELENQYAEIVGEAYLDA